VEFDDVCERHESWVIGRKAAGLLPRAKLIELPDVGTGSTSPMWL
jgi:hypothetical protein